MAQADFLDNTVILDLQTLTRHPLEFVISEHGPKKNVHPNSSVDRYGAVSNAWEWGIESADALGDKASKKKIGYLTTYLFPTDQDEYLVGHSLGPLLDAVTTLMRDDERGDKVCRLVKKHWTKTYRLLSEGAGMPHDVGLMKVRTDGDYWFIGAFLTSRTPGVVDIEPRAVDELRELMFHVLDEALGGLAALAVQVDLAFDRRTEQLNLAAEVFNGLAELLQAVSDS